MNKEKKNEINERYDNLLSKYPQKIWLIQNLRNAELMKLEEKDEQGKEID